MELVYESVANVPASFGAEVAGWGAAGRSHALPLRSEPAMRRALLRAASSLLTSPEKGAPASVGHIHFHSEEPTAIPATSDSVRECI